MLYACLQKVWDDRGPGHLRFEGEGGGSQVGAGPPPLGFISEHGLIHSSLFGRARELEAAGAAEVICPAQASIEIAFTVYEALPQPQTLSPLQA